MIEKILEFHCIVLDCNNYEIELINDCYQDKMKLSHVRITEFSMTYLIVRVTIIERKIVVNTMPVRRQYLNKMTIIQI
jgi:hypothetical protein